VQTDSGGGQNMPLFHTPCSGYPGAKGDFFYCPYLITSSSFSGNADLADEVIRFHARKYFRVLYAEASSSRRAVS